MRRMTTRGGVVLLALAIAIVLIELWAIAWIRARYMDTKFLRAAFEVALKQFLTTLDIVMPRPESLPKPSCSSCHCGDPDFGSVRGGAFAE